MDTNKIKNKNIKVILNKNNSKSSISKYTPKRINYQFVDKG